jgi:hypothetical protein
MIPATGSTFNCERDIVPPPPDPPQPASAEAATNTKVIPVILFIFRLGGIVREMYADVVKALLTREC